MTRDEIKKYFPAKNFMTPDILEYGQRKQSLYELSEGEFMHRKLFGVTVVALDIREEDHSLSTSFTTLNKAYAYIDSGFNPKLKEV